MPLDDPVTAMANHIEFTFINCWAGRVIRAVPPEVFLRDIGAFQPGCPFQSTCPEPLMHSFQVSDYIAGEWIGCGDEKVNVTGLGIEVSTGEGAIEVHPNELVR